MDRPRQCSARHGQKMYLRCRGEVTDTSTHIEDHWATDRDGAIVHWSGLTAIYPAIGELGPEVPEPASERQVGGEHYRKFKIQPWDIVDEYELSYYAGNALKYLLRAGRKGAALEDLKKCRHYLDKLVELAEAGDA